MFDLSGKLAFVTDSSRGIGKAFAIKLATVKTTQAIFCKSFRLRTGGRRKPPLKNLNFTVKIKKIRAYRSLGFFVYISFAVFKRL